MNFVLASPPSSSQIQDENEYRKVYERDIEFVQTTCVKQHKTNPKNNSNNREKPVQDAKKQQNDVDEFRVVIEQIQKKKNKFRTISKNSSESLFANHSLGDLHNGIHNQLDERKNVTLYDEIQSPQQEIQPYTKSMRILNEQLYTKDKKVELKHFSQKFKCCFVLINELFFVNTINTILKINHLLSKYHKTLELKDLPTLKPEERTEHYCPLYYRVIRQLETLQRDFNFYTIFFWNQNLQFTLVMSFLGVIEANSNFFISLFIFNMIEQFSENDGKDLYMNAFYVIILTFISTISKHYQYLQLSKYGGQLRQIFIFLLLEKVSTLSYCSIQEQSSGSILNLISSDLSSLESLYGYIYCLPIVPISLVISGWILWDKFSGIYGLIALVICILTYPTQTLIQKLVQSKLKKLKEFQDFRIKQQSNFFDNIQTIKMYCWQIQLSKMIFNTKLKELKQFLLIQFLTLIDRSINQSINLWGSLLFLIIVSSLGVELTLQNIILTIQLMATIRYYCVHQVSYGLKAIITLNVIFTRAQQILKIKALFAEQFAKKDDQAIFKGQTNLELTSYKEISQFSLIQIPDRERNNNYKSNVSINQLQEETITMKQVNCYWSQSKPPILKNINFSASNGQLISVIGKTGSGKTTFLQLILKEIPYITGSLEIREQTTFRYVDQDPFINPTSIKENILFGKEFDQELFLEVIHATNIFSDIMMFPDKENTKIGENGATLSGGQKSRLSLARALYSMPDVYLLDDPLSAVDSKVAKHLFTQAIQNFIFKFQVNRQNKNFPIVIMTTHHLNYALKCDIILVIDEGQIIFSGKSQDVASQIEKILNVTAAETDENQEQEQIQQNKKIGLKENLNKVKIEPSSFLLNKESIIKTMKLFLHYFTYQSFCIVILLNLLTEAIRNVFYRILTAYVAAEGLENYLFILVVLIVSNLINNILKYFICSSSILKTNNTILQLTMQRLANAKKSYLDKQSSGFIMSKYTTDFAIIDSQMPIVLIDILEDGIQFVVSLVMVAIFQPFFILPIIITICLSYYLFMKVTPVLSQLKLNDLHKRSPLLSHFKTYLQGLIHFRLSDQFSNQKQKFFDLANESFQSNYFYHQTQKCFSLYVDLIALFAKASGVFLIIIFIKDEALFSQALLLLQSFHSQNTLLRQSMEFNGLLNSYSRLFDLLNVEVETDKQQELQLPHAWPKQGTISVKNLTLTYDPSQQPVLKSINFEIKAGEKVAFVGRTGAGKSSVIAALFHLVDLNEDVQILIDDCNTRNLSLRQLRSSLAIIPQQPFLFSGTFKQNLDPSNTQDDKDIWKALSDVGMDNFIEQQTYLLNTNISDLNLSAGQKQLLCLARAILFRKKIIILDEASANIDLVTDQHIQQIIQQKFIDCSIIAIAHRINTVSHYDKIIVLENGEIVEEGVPFQLLCNDINDTEITKKSKFAGIIKETGKKNAQNIFQIAKDTFQIQQLRKKRILERNY